jgi:GNAT superfamily N-acetyltransferase
MITQFEPITTADLKDLKNLQPPDWSDIIPDVSYYISAPFCFPIKALVKQEIAGMGAAIIYGRTAWLAHIIVHSSFRNQGIGYTIVKKLLDIVNKSSAESCLLTATAMGKPVYEKAGFRTVSEYVFMNRESLWNEKSVSGHVTGFTEAMRQQIYQLDLKVSGENRQLLLSDFIKDTMVYSVNDKVLGYCIPRLKEGPIIALTSDAGLELMKIKYRKSDKAVIPDENAIAWRFLKENGFRETETKGTRMILGKDIKWEPLNIYSRAGGNFG